MAELLVVTPAALVEMLVVFEAICALAAVRFVAFVATPMAFVETPAVLFATSAVFVAIPAVFAEILVAVSYTHLTLPTICSV